MEMWVMNSCKQSVEKIKQLFQRIPTLRPVKNGKIFIQVQDCLISIEKKLGDLFISIYSGEESENDILITYLDFETLDYVLNAKDLYDYGDRLVYSVVLKQKIYLKSNKMNPIRHPFHKLMCRKRMKKGIGFYEMVIPCHF